MPAGETERRLGRGLKKVRDGHLILLDSLTEVSGKGEEVFQTNLSVTVQVELGVVPCGLLPESKIGRASCRERV